MFRILPFSTTSKDSALKYLNHYCHVYVYLLKIVHLYWNLYQSPLYQICSCSLGVEHQKLNESYFFWLKRGNSRQINSSRKVNSIFRAWSRISFLSLQNIDNTVPCNLFIFIPTIIYGIFVTKNIDSTFQKVYSKVITIPYQK